MEEIDMGNLEYQFQLCQSVHDRAGDCRVVAIPPGPACAASGPRARSMARMRRARRPSRPGDRASCCPTKKVPMGLAMPLPVISNADPWMGSNMEGNFPLGVQIGGGADAQGPASARQVERMSP